MGRQEGREEAQGSAASANEARSPPSVGRGFHSRSTARPDTPSAPIATFPLPPNPAGFGADLELAPAQLTDY